MKEKINDKINEIKEPEIKKKMIEDIDAMTKPVLVAVLDTGIYGDHHDLSSRVVRDQKYSRTFAGQPGKIRLSFLT